MFLFLHFFCLKQVNNHSKIYLCKGKSLRYNKKYSLITIFHLMNLESTLNDELLMQPFAELQNEVSMLNQGKQIAFAYSKIENAIAVLSDLKSDKSYIYHGGVSEKLGLGKKDEVKNINSIWEKDLFRKIHPDDLTEKYAFELQFFHFLKNIPVDERSDYHILSNMRIMDNTGNYVFVKHRMFYVCSCPQGNLWLALCLYSFSHEKFSNDKLHGVIVNSKTGEILSSEAKDFRDLLTKREIEILKLIEKGEMSQDIADILSISKYTVSRHRQNILIKLRVKNSFEACRIAKLMDLI